MEEIYNQTSNQKTKPINLKKYESKNFIERQEMFETRR